MGMSPAGWVVPRTCTAISNMSMLTHAQALGQLGRVWSGPSSSPRVSTLRHLLGPLCPGLGRTELANTWLSPWETFGQHQAGGKSSLPPTPLGT